MAAGTLVGVEEAVEAVGEKVARVVASLPRSLARVMEERVMTGAVRTSLRLRDRAA